MMHGLCPISAQNPLENAQSSWHMPGNFDLLIMPKVMTAYSSWPYLLCCARHLRRGHAAGHFRAEHLQAGAYTRPLLSSTWAVSDTPNIP